MEEGLFVGGLIAMIVATTLRLTARSGPLSWLYSLLYFGVTVAVFVGCFGADPQSGEANGIGVAAALVTHFIAFLRSGTTEQPTVQEPPPVQSKRPKPAATKSAPKQQKQPPQQTKKPAATKVKPVVQAPKPQPQPAPAPKTVQKKEEPKQEPVKQTLRTCMRCGKTIQNSNCGYCGYNHASGSVRLLSRVDPRKLQIPKR